MKRVYILFMLIVLLSGLSTMDAQVRRSGKGYTHKRTNKTQRKTNKFTTTAKPIIADTISTQIVEQKTNTAKSKEHPYKGFSNPLALRYLRGGFLSGNKLTLLAKEKYEKLDLAEKSEIMKIFKNDFPDCEIIVDVGEDRKELWSSPAGMMLEKWTVGDMGLEQYSSLEIKTGGGRQIFYNVGGSLSGVSKSLSGNVNIRAGTYLFRQILDASVSCSAGFTRNGDGNAEFTGDVSVDTRAYLRIKKIKVSPYAGVGVSWVYAPSSFIEPRFLGGLCCFIGPGSLDVGYQYGTKSKGSLTLGYTFRTKVKLPSLKKAKKILAK